MAQDYAKSKFLFFSQTTDFELVINLLIIELGILIALLTAIIIYNFVMSNKASQKRNFGCLMGIVILSIIIVVILLIFAHLDYKTFLNS